MVRIPLTYCVHSGKFSGGERRELHYLKGKVAAEYTIIWLAFIIGGVWSGVWAGRRVCSLADI